MRSACALLLALFACKSESAAPAVEGSASGGEASGAPPAPIGASMPTVPEAKVLSQKQPSPNHAVATWCIDQPDAVELIRRALVGDHWTHVRTRGDLANGRSSLAAAKDASRFSATFGGSDERCGGTVVTATVMRLGKVTMPAVGGEQIH